jgi:hypothetical protein
MADKNSPYIVYRGLEQGNKFFSTNNPNEPESEKVKLDDGTVAYEILGYAETPDEARAIIWPKRQPTFPELLIQNMAEIIPKN